jgi:hypothetical protein
MARTKEKIEDNQVYQAIDGISFGGADGAPVTIAPGVRLRGTHEAVQRFPELFSPMLLAMTGLPLLGTGSWPKRWPRLPPARSWTRSAWLFSTKWRAK